MSCAPLLCPSPHMHRASPNHHQRVCGTLARQTRSPLSTLSTILELSSIRRQDTRHRLRLSMQAPRHHFPASPRSIIDAPSSTPKFQAHISKVSAHPRDHPFPPSIYRCSKFQSTRKWLAAAPTSMTPFLYGIATRSTSTTHTSLGTLFGMFLSSMEPSDPHICSQSVISSLLGAFRVPETRPRLLVT